jgi:hypothetical protein
MFEYFYNEIFRRTIISFGSLFNNIIIKQEGSDGNTANQFRVPLAYGPTQKFLARINQQPDLNKSVSLSLPRMSFEFVGLNYDPSRKITQTQKFKKSLTSSQSDIQTAYMPVPYNMDFELAIMTKLNDDMLQIVEQILPYFQPAYSMSVNLVETIGEKRDIPVVLEGVSMSDDYEGDYTTRRALVYTLRFSVKTYLFGPITSASADIIKKVSLGYVAGSTGTGTPQRDLTYAVEPRAIKNYTGTILTNLTEDVIASATVIKVDDKSTITENTYIEIDGEEMYVTEVLSTDSIKVKRGQDNTDAIAHVKGAEVKSITNSDDALIEDGDDFGFSVTY